MSRYPRNSPKIDNQATKGLLGKQWLNVQQTTQQQVSLLAYMNMKDNKL